MGQSGPRALFTPTSLPPSAHAPASPVRRPSGFCGLFAPSTASPGRRPGEEEEEEEEEAAAAMKLSTQAYCKMVLHGAKYPHCAVNGLLVAEKQPPPQRGRERESPAQALLVDCIPLFHGSLALAPMLEVALSLIDSWCRENSYVIAGYYQANERVKDASPNLLAEKVASRIAENFSDTALIMVDNTKFTMKCLKPAVHVYEHHENKWRCRDPHIDYCEDWTEAQRISESLLDSRSYETLVDFDNHLDDIRNDWTNPEINKAVLHLC